MAQDPKDLKARIDALVATAKPVEPAMSPLEERALAEEIHNRIGGLGVDLGEFEWGTAAQRHEARYLKNRAAFLKGSIASISDAMHASRAKVRERWEGHTQERLRDEIESAREEHWSLIKTQEERPLTPDEVVKRDAAWDRMMSGHDAFSESIGRVMAAQRAREDAHEWWTERLALSDEVLALAPETTFSEQVAGGLGSTAGGIVTGLVTRNPGAATAVFMGQSAAGMERDALAMGASPEQAAAAYRGGAAIGAMEILPVMRVVNLLGKMGGKGVLTKGLAAAAAGAGAEAPQEALQTGLEFLMAEHLIEYAPKRGGVEWAKDMFHAGLVGGTVGAMLGGSSGLARGVADKVTQSRQRGIADQFLKGQEGDAVTLLFREADRLAYQGGSAKERKALLSEAYRRVDPTGVEQRQYQLQLLGEMAAEGKDAELAAQIEFELEVMAPIVLQRGRELNKLDAEQRLKQAESAPADRQAPKDLEADIRAANVRALEAQLAYTNSQLQDGASMDGQTAVDVDTETLGLTEEEAPGGVILRGNVQIAWMQGKLRERIKAAKTAKFRELGAVEEGAEVGYVEQSLIDTVTKLKEQGVEVPDIVVMDTPVKLPMQGAYHDGRMVVQLTEDPDISDPETYAKSILFHELLHGTARVGSASFRNLVAAVRETAPEFAMAMRDAYVARVRNATGEDPSPGLKRRSPETWEALMFEEGMALAAENMPSVIETLLSDPEKLADALAKDRSLFEWLRDFFSRILARIGVDIDTSTERRAEKLASTEGDRIAFMEKRDQLLRAMYELDAVHGVGSRKEALEAARAIVAAYKAVGKAEVEQQLLLENAQIKEARARREAAQERLDAGGDPGPTQVWDAKKEEWVERRGPGRYDPKAIPLGEGAKEASVAEEAAEEAPVSTEPEEAPRKRSERTKRREAPRPVEELTPQQKRRERRRRKRLRERIAKLPEGSRERLALERELGALDPYRGQRRAEETEAQEMQREAREMEGRRAPAPVPAATPAPLPQAAEPPSEPQAAAEPAEAPAVEPAPEAREKPAELPEWYTAIMGEEATKEAEGRLAAEKREAAQSKPAQRVIEIDLEVVDLEAQIEDWASREYKTNAGRIEQGGHGDGSWGAAGDGQGMTIGGINEKRRRDRIQGFERGIERLEEERVGLVRELTNRYGREIAADTVPIPSAHESRRKRKSEQREADRQREMEERWRKQGTLILTVEHEVTQSEASRLWDEGVRPVAERFLAADPLPADQQRKPAPEAQQVEAAPEGLSDEELAAVELLMEDQGVTQDEAIAMLREMQAEGGVEPDVTVAEMPRTEPAADKPLTAAERRDRRRKRAKERLRKKREEILRDWDTPFRLWLRAAGGLNPEGGDLARYKRKEDTGALKGLPPGFPPLVRAKGKGAAPDMMLRRMIEAGWFQEGENADIRQVEQRLYDESANPIDHIIELIESDLSRAEIHGSTEGATSFDYFAAMDALEDLDPFGVGELTAEEEAEIQRKVKEGEIPFSVAQTATPEFRRWFRDSKVVDAQGRPLVVYHGTLDRVDRGEVTPDFTVFGPLQHFGTSEAANDRMRHLRGHIVRTTNRGDVRQRAYPVFLNIQSPLSIEDSGDGSLQGLRRAVYKALGLGKAPSSPVVDGFYRHNHPSIGEDILRVAEAAGHDGLTYRNRIEDRGSDSWVPFHRHQIKSATGNVGAFGQRPVTEAEAAPLGMTAAEANEAQARGDIRFSVSPEWEAAFNAAQPGDEVLPPFTLETRSGPVDVAFERGRGTWMYWEARSGASLAGSGAIAVEDGFAVSKTVTVEPNWRRHGIYRAVQDAVRVVADVRSDVALTGDSEAYYKAIGAELDGESGRYIRPMADAAAPDTRFSVAPAWDTPEWKAMVARMHPALKDGEMPREYWIGTTHRVTAFDPERFNPENDMGRGIYASSSREDVRANYAGEGPDLTNRIESRAEELADAMADEPEMFGFEPGYEVTPEEVEAEARRELHGGRPHSKRVYMALENPAILGGPGETRFELEFDEETGEESGSLVDFWEALRGEASLYDDVDMGELQESVFDGFDSVGLSDLISAVKERGLQDAVDYEADGALVSGEIVRAALERMGFDGIVDNTVYSKFGAGRPFGRPMAGMSPDTQHVIAFRSSQVKSVWNRRPTSSPDMRYSVAPTSQLGFYSNTEDAFERMVAKSGAKKVSGKQLVSRVLSAGGNKEEIAWMGLESWASEYPEPRIPVDAVREFIRENGIVVGEKVLEDAPRVPQIPADTKAELARLHREIDALDGPLSYGIDGVMWEDGSDPRRVALFRERDALQRRYRELYDPIERAQDEARNRPQPKHSDYQLPGGESYRELLLTLPVKTADNTRERSVRVKVYLYDGHKGLETVLRQDQIADSRAEGHRVEVLDRINVDTYEKGHYGDTPNVLAHVRFNERVGPNGERILFLEEVQSDWHQAGREKGYAGDFSSLNAQVRAAAQRQGGDMKAVEWAIAQLVKEPIAAKNPDAQRAWEILNAETGDTPTFDLDLNGYHDLRTSGVPDAPFKTSWEKLSMRRMVRWAAENGFDQIAWTTGVQQVERYETSYRQAVNEIRWTPTAAGEAGAVDVDVETTRGGTLELEVTSDGAVKSTDAKLDGQGIAAVVGKVIAKRILSEESGVASGDDLTIGGEGMKAAYDRRLVGIANKLGKQFGAKVGRIDLETQPFVKHVPPPGEQALDIQAQHESVHSLPITESMRSSVLEGQPMFSVAATDGNLDPRADGAIQYGELSRLELVRRRMQDYFYPVRKAQRSIGEVPESMDVDLAETLFSGRAGSRLLTFEKEATKELNDILGDVLDLDDAHDFAYAAHAPERNEWIKKQYPDGGWGTEAKPGSGLRTSTAKKFVREKLQGEHGNRYRRLNRFLRRMARQELRVLDEAGLLTEAFKKGIDAQGYKYYVPLIHTMQGKPTIVQGRGFSVRGSGIKRAGGRTSAPDNVVLNLLAKNQQAIVRSEKARVDRALWNLVTENPDPSLWTTMDVPVRIEDDGSGVLKQLWDVRIDKLDQTVFVTIDGEVKAVVFNERGKDLARALNKTGVDGAHAILRKGRKVLRYLAAINTSWNPEFVVTNFLRDAQTAGIVVGAEGKGGVRAVLKGALPAIREIHRHERGKEDSAMWQRMMDAGGKTGWYHAKSLDEIQQDLSKAIRRMQRTGGKRAMNTGHAIAEAVENANSAVENGVRLSAFKWAVSQGATDAQAAEFAKNLTVNFNRQGEAQWLSSLYLFANAGIQGSTRVITTLAKYKYGKRVAAGLVLGGFFSDLLNYAASPDDEDGENAWDAHPEWAKDRYFMLPDGDGGFFSVPMPYGFNFFQTLGRKMSEIARYALGEGGSKPTQAGADILSSALGAFSPIGDFHSADWQSGLRFVSPTVLDPLVELATNRDWRNAPIRPEGSPFDRVEPPSHTVAWDSTNAIWKSAAGGLNWLTGGGEFTEGGVSLSPEDLQYLTEFALGGVLRFGNRTVNAIGQIPDGPVKALSDAPWIRQLHRTESERKGWSTFRENAVEIEWAQNAYDVLRERGDREAAAEVKEEFGHLLGLHSALKRMDRRRERARKKIDAAEGDAKDALQDDLYADIRAFNREVSEARQ